MFRVGGQEYRVPYLPGESDTGMFGGNSNWRGPIWMPVNALIIRALLQYYAYYGNEFTVECPTGSGRQMNLYQVAEEISRRLTSIFLKGQGWPPARERRREEVPGRSALARLHPVLRILPRRQRRGTGRQPPDRLDRASSPAPCTCSPPRPPTRFSNSARTPPLLRWNRSQRAAGLARSLQVASRKNQNARHPQSIWRNSGLRAFRAN